MSLDAGVGAVALLVARALFGASLLFVAIGGQAWGLAVNVGLWM